MTNFCGHFGLGHSSLTDDKLDFSGNWEATINPSVIFRGRVNQLMGPLKADPHPPSLHHYV